MTYKTTKTPIGLTLVFLVLVPGVVALLVPMLLLRFNVTPFHLNSWRWTGLLMAAIGAAMYLRCSVDFARFGRGIPAPIAPTQFLVRNGFYRHVRNPMYIAGSLTLFGEAVALESRVVLAYAAAVTLCYHPAVVLLEEPALRKRFGASYIRYCDHVPRWVPRLWPAHIEQDAP